MSEVQKGGVLGCVSGVVWGCGIQSGGWSTVRWCTGVGGFTAGGVWSRVGW